MFKKILKIIAYVLVLIVFIVIVVAGFTQSKFFKERLRVILVSELSQALNADFFLGTIKGNFITGFSVDSISIFKDEKKFLSVKNIKLTHDPFTIVGKKLTLRKIVVEALELNFIRYSDSVWNIRKIFQPTDQESKPLAWTIDLKDFKINKAELTLFDSTKPIYIHPKDTLTKYFDYRHFKIDNIKLHFSGLIKNQDYNFQIKDLKFYIPSTDFNLLSFSAGVKLNKNSIEVDKLLVETNNSSFRLDASLKDLNIFEKLKLSDFEDKPVKLKLMANKFDLNELKTFLPAVYFLNGNVYADIDASGNFGAVQVNSLNLKIFDSYLNLNGTILNLHNPENLFLDVKINESQVVVSNVSELLPVFHIPKFSELKPIKISASYYGKPQNFIAKCFTSSANLGSVNVNLNLNLQDTLMKYEAEFETKNLNLFPITKINELTSALNTKGKLIGQGTKIDEIDSKLVLYIDSSIVDEIKIQKINYDLSFKNREANFSLFLLSDALDADVRSNIAYLKDDRPKYNIDAKFSNLNIAKIIDNKDYTSNISFQIKGFIEGNNIDEQSGKVNIHLMPSVFADKKLDQEKIDIIIDQENSTQKKIFLTSENFELALNGKFNLKENIKIFGDLVSNLSSEINNIFEGVKTSLREDEIVVEEIDTEFNFQYELKSKNLNLIARLFSKVPFNFNGHITGEVKYSDNILIGKSNIKINDYFVGTETKGMLVSNATIEMFIDTLNKNEPLNNSNIKLNFSTEQININNLKLYDVKLISQYSNFKGVITVENKFNNETNFNTKVLFNTDLNDLNIEIPELQIALKSYKINADTVANIIINKEGTFVNNLRLVSTEGEKIYARGSLDKDEKLKLDTQVDNFNLENIQLFIPAYDVNKKFTGKTNLTLKASGTLKEPVYDCRITIDSITYKNSNFGRLNGIFKYNEKLLNLSISAINSENQKDESLLIFGNLPIDLSLTEVKNRFPESNVELNIKTSSFQLGVLNPLIPLVDNLTGNLTCDIKINGTALNPNFTGKLDLKDVRFLLLTNYVYYNISGSLLTDYNKIYFTDFYIKNEKTDFADGIVNLTGHFGLKEYKIDYFDINAKGQLLLLKEGVRRRAQNIYGKLIATTEDDGIDFKGNILSSNIAGTIVIKEANLVFPPSANQTYVETDNLVRYVAVNDTIVSVAQKSFKQEFYISNNDGKSSYWIQDIPTTNKFLSGLTYDLVLYTKGTTTIRMIFNPATNEELYAELDGRVNLQRYSNKNYFIGEISISERSYYNFFKRFDASGKLKFIGDPNNPELEIKATYTGTRQVPATLQDTAIIDQKVVIGLDIAGTRMEPKLIMSIKIDDKDYADVIPSGDLQSDAISFLFTGKFRDDLNAREKSDIITGIGATAGKSLIAGATSTMLSGILTDFLRKEFRFIRTAEVTYAGGSLQQSADLRLSGQIFNAYWRFGGKIFDDINNANVSFILNFGDVFESQKMKNFYLELERKVDGREYGIDRKLTNSAKIYYKWSF